MSSSSNAGLFRRLSAMVYDGLLLMALIFTYGAIVIGVRSWLFDLPENEVAARGIFFQLGILATVVGFYLYFWRHGGQTLGMRAWRLKLETSDNANSRPSISACLIRLASGTLSLALGGLGYWWCLVDKNNRTLHDYLSRTDVIVIPKK